MVHPNNPKRTFILGQREYEIGAIQCAEKTNSTERKSLVLFVSFIENDTNDWLKDEPSDLTCFF
jgi:hypothetical protein